MACVESARCVVVGKFIQSKLKYIGENIRCSSNKHLETVRRNRSILEQGTWMGSHMHTDREAWPA